MLCVSGLEPVTVLGCEAKEREGCRWTRGLFGELMLRQDLPGAPSVFTGFFRCGRRMEKSLCGGELK